LPDLLAALLFIRLNGPDILSGELMTDVLRQWVKTPRRCDLTIPPKQYPAASTSSIPDAATRARVMFHPESLAEEDEDFLNALEEDEEEQARRKAKKQNRNQSVNVGAAPIDVKQEEVESDFEMIDEIIPDAKEYVGEEIQCVEVESASAPLPVVVPASSHSIADPATQAAPSPPFPDPATSKKRNREDEKSEDGKTGPASAAAADLEPKKKKKKPNVPRQDPVLRGLNISAASLLGMHKLFPLFVILKLII
jgi:hypothetical protein